MPEALADGTVEFTCFTLCPGIGGLSLGLSRASAELPSSKLGPLKARMRSLGGIDSDPAACRDFEMLTGVRATCRDLFDLADFRDYHHACKTARKRCKTCGNTGEPPKGWTPMTAADVLQAAGGECPDVLAWSPPCKGFSGLNAGARSKSRRYRALNNLVLRALTLALDAFGADLPALMLMENVPLISTKGRWLLDAVRGILESYGYAVAETVHCCGELGGLGQRRKRFLMVARLRSKVPPFLYEPEPRGLKTVGQVLADLPLPGDPAGGPMHRVPKLQWRTWVRLALIEAGRDWRSLNRLAVEDGQLKDYGIVPARAWFGNTMGVLPWERTAGTVTGAAKPSTGTFSVADPRSARDLGRYQPYGVVAWDETSQTVTSQAAAGSGPFSVQDPRLDCDEGDRQTRRHCNVYRVVRWDEVGGCVTGASGNSRPNVADPRTGSMGQHSGKLSVQPWDEAGRTVHGSVRVGSGGAVIQDPRPGWSKGATGAWSSTGHYGVLSPEQTSGAVTGSAKHDNGTWSVADWRLPAPLSRPDLPPLIIALDGTWHRPLTTLELGVLQGFRWLDPLGRPLKLDGDNEGRWRMGLGNAVPPEAAEVMGNTMLRTLLMAWADVSFALSSTPIWCRPLATALSVDLGPHRFDTGGIHA
jgi:site-specific DNA-cytosine methylase